MNNESAHEAGILGDVSRNLGALFRHLLPGVLIICAAIVAHPSWFTKIDGKSWQHIVLGTTVALASGNIWFAVNRYGVAQLIDLIAYVSKAQGRIRDSIVRYTDDIGRYVAKSLTLENVSALARQHVQFRASSVLLLYTVAEVGLLFALWHEPGTLFERYQSQLIFAAAVIFALGVWQDFITRSIDFYIVEGATERTPE